MTSGAPFPHLWFYRIGLDRDPGPGLAERLPVARLHVNGVRAPTMAQTAKRASDRMHGGFQGDARVFRASPLFFGIKHMLLYGIASVRPLKAIFLQ